MLFPKLIGNNGRRGWSGRQTWTWQAASVVQGFPEREKREGKIKKKNNQKSTVEIWMPRPEPRGHLNHCQAGRCWQGMPHSDSYICDLCYIQEIHKAFPNLSQNISLYPQSFAVSLFSSTWMMKVEPSWGALPIAKRHCSPPPLVLGCLLACRGRNKIKGRMILW